MKIDLTKEEWEFLSEACHDHAKNYQDAFFSRKIPNSFFNKLASDQKFSRVLLEKLGSEWVAEDGERVEWTKKSKIMSK